MTGSIRQSTSSMIKLLRASSALNDNLVQNRIYPPGIVESATMPRIEVSQVTPTDKLAGIGITAAYPTWKMVSFVIDVWDKDPKRCELVSEIIEDVIGANRNYVPGTVVLNDQSGVATSVSASGYFMLLRVSGGTPTSEVRQKQLYRRTLNVTGRWFQTG